MRQFVPYSSQHRFDLVAFDPVSAHQRARDRIGKDLMQRRLVIATNHVAMVSRYFHVSSFQWRHR
jgi:hypothetical protein